MGRIRLSRMEARRSESGKRTRRSLRSVRFMGGSEIRLEEGLTRLEKLGVLIALLSRL